MSIHFSNLHPIDQIKTLVEEERLSFLVGAGFGKNISTVFPFWNELFADAIWDKYGSGKQSDRKKKEKAVAEKVIREQGLLGVASKIVSDAGFHEAVDDYIEQHIPYLDWAEDDSVVLKIAGRQLKENAVLDCHQLLRQLNIRNIYTFNYDNALEFCLGDKRVLSNNKIRLESDLERKKQEKDSLSEEYRLFLREFESLKSGSPSLTYETSGPDSIKSVGEYNRRENLEDKNRAYLNRFKELDENLFAISNKLKDVQKKLDDSYLVITRSSDIARTEDGRNIYKIHGSLRVNSNDEYGFDGDKHTQYIITREDYDDYERKHGAFVNLMRIDLLRKRFCILGVSGADANFLAWISWVKDVLDKTGNEKGSDQKHSFFVYSGGDDLPRDMSQMLENHFIVPVILKDFFPEAQNDSERVKLFLEYIQPRINNTERMIHLWKDVDRRDLEPDKSFEIEQTTLKQLCELSKVNLFFKPLSVIHHTAIDVADSAYRFLQDADENKSKLLVAAVRCSMLPLRPSLLRQMNAVLRSSRDPYLQEGLGYVTRRHKLLYDPQSLTKAELASDGYTSILKRLYLYDFPTEKECFFICDAGLDYVRLFSLQRMLYGSSSIDLKDERIVPKFANPQELTLAGDWLYLLARDLESPVVEAANRYSRKYGTYHLGEYIEAYLDEMREKKEPSTYGNVPENIYLGGRVSGYENAAVLLNSFIELGVTFAGYTVLSDNDWIDLVHELMPYHPFALVFYTVARGSTEQVVNRVAQELVYDRCSYASAPVILDRILSALCNRNVPDYFTGPMANFARRLFVAVPVAKWGRVFKEKIVTCLDYADKKGSFNTKKALYAMVCDGLNYIRDKKVRLALLKRVLLAKPGTRMDNNLNALAISARDGISIKDFEPYSELLVEFTRKSKGQSYIPINLASLLGKGDLVKVCDDLESQALQDNLVVVPYSYMIRGLRETDGNFKAQLVNRKDVWQSGITESGIRMGDGIVKVSVVDKVLHFNDSQVLLIWDSLVDILGMVEARLKQSGNSVKDKGFISIESAFRELVMDMQLFVFNHKDLLQRQYNYKEVLDSLSQTYYRCCFNKTMLGMIFDDEIYRAIRGMMTVTEMGGLDSLMSEYKALVSLLLTRKSDSINYLFLHLSWMLKKHREFFEQQEFVTLFLAVLDTYAGYFVDDESQMRWDVNGCEKETAEMCLVEIARELNKWGYQHPFWTGYKRRYFVKLIN